MSNKIDIFLLDDSNNTIEEINIEKPRTYQLLLIEIKNKFHNLSENFIIFYLSQNNKEVIINNNNVFQLSKEILFIRPIKNNNLEQSLFQMNYDQLSESKKDILDEKYNCFICKTLIKKEKPYFCYICQKIYHIQCLEHWNNVKQQKHLNLDCPNCRNKLPLEYWKQRLDFEDNRIEVGKVMNKMNEYKLKNNLNNNVNIIKEKKINQLKDDNIRHNKEIEEYNHYIKKISLLFINILNKIKRINSFFEPRNNIRLINLIKHLSSNNIPSINNLSNVIFEELDFLERSLDEMNNKKIEKKNEINLVYFTENEGVENIFGKNFVEKNKNNIELIINGKLTALTNAYPLKKGENIIKMNIKNRLTNLNDMFNNCSKLINIEDLKYLDTKEVDDYSYVFWECTSLSDITPLEYWNVSNGKSFQSMFGGCISLFNITPLKNWNVSKSNNFSAMFFKCVLLTDISPLENWKVFNGNNFSGMFSKCSQLSDIRPLQNWNVKNGNNFSAMFFECISLSDISPLRNWNVSNGKIFSRMFCGCRQLKDYLLLERWKLPNDKFNSLLL